MYIEQMYTGCLAQAAYYLESNGEAVIIDPLRDIDQYLKKAAERKAKIRYILETHFHADFVSGHVDLMKETGAQIVYGPTARPGFEALIAHDEQTFRAGDLNIRVLHTPGHTMESCCYLVTNDDEKDCYLFSGDTLFLGDVGRPDLAQKAANLSKEELAGLLYDSIQNKIMPLADDTIIYPGHGAGSACGKHMSTDRQDTLGHQKLVNYALRSGLSKEVFVKDVLTGLTRPPQYFPSNVSMNKNGYSSIEQVIERGMTPLNADEFDAVASADDVLVLDTRRPQDFAKCFIPGAVNIGIDGDFAPWAGTLIDNLQQPILIVADEHRVREVIIRLARVGYDNCIGYLDGGMNSWTKAEKFTDYISSISAGKLADRLEVEPDAILIDIRRRGEYEKEHVTGAGHMPLEYINEQLAELDMDTLYYVYCAGGYRSMIFISILRARGYNNLIDVQGGFKAIKENGRLFTTTLGENHQLN